MADMVKYGNAYSHFTLNGIETDDWGETDPPLTMEDLADRATLKRGTGARSVRLDSVTRPKRVTLNLLPGGTQARQILALEKTGADFYGKWVQEDTGEIIDLFGGILKTRGQLGRAGRASVTDEQFIFEFNDSEET